MYVKITDSSYPLDHCRRSACINTAHIESITRYKESITKVKIHLVSGKEFIADKECLTNIENTLGTKIDWDYLYYD